MKREFTNQIGTGKSKPEKLVLKQTSTRSISGKFLTSKVMNFWFQKSSFTQTNFKTAV
jgi:hypothetical protein